MVVVTQEEAEQLEAIFLRVRVAAGLPQASEGGDSHRSKPDPEAVVARYVAMQRDVLTVSNTLRDLQQRLVYLQEARADHQAALEPRARDETDETGTNRTEIDDLRHRRACTAPPLLYPSWLFAGHSILFGRCCRLGLRFQSQWLNGRSRARSRKGSACIN